MHVVQDFNPPPGGLLPSDGIYVVPYPPRVTTGRGAVAFSSEWEVFLSRGSAGFTIADVGADTLVDLDTGVAAVDAPPGPDAP